MIASVKSPYMRVALLSDSFLPHAGGSRVYYYNLLKRISATGDEITVITSKVNGWQQFDLKEQTNSFRIQRNFKSPTNHSFLQIPKTIGPMLACIVSSLRDRPDIIHCGDLYPQGLIGVLLKKTLGIPFVSYCHGEDITLIDERRFQPKLRDLIYRSADAIIANGEFAVQNLLRIGVEKSKIHKITPGLDVTSFHPQPPDAALRQHYGIEQGELVLMTVARLVSRKGHSRVLRALAQLRPNVPPFKYVIVGRGPLENELRALTAELNLQEIVKFAGFVSDDQLNDHYNLADIVVMPNTGDDGDVEGFGMVFLEANAAGKPVIGGRSGGTAEAIIDRVTGYLVDPTDDRELRDALHFLLTDSEQRHRMGDAGLQRAQTEFSWDLRAAAVKQINYDVVAASKR
jgi:phosphatidyl-myo-inositol dimannoside synthase